MAFRSQRLHILIASLKTMPRLKVLIVVAWLVSPGAPGSVLLFAQESTELEGRFLVHIQRGPEQGLGFAGWLVLPEIIRNSPSRILLLAGVMEKWEGRWLELMGGVLRIGDQTQPVLNLRFSKSDIEFLDLFLELQHNISSRTFYVNPIATTPFEAGGLGFKVGLEADWFLHRQGDTMFLGPRISTRFGLGGVIKNVQVTGAYKWQRGGANIMRIYLLLNV